MIIEKLNEKSSEKIEIQKLISTLKLNIFQYFFEFNGDALSV
jgi:hypothetical protein